MNIFDENTFIVEDEKPLSFGKVALIGLTVAIVAYALLVSFEVMRLPSDVQSEVLSIVL